MRSFLHAHHSIVRPEVLYFGLSETLRRRFSSDHTHTHTRGIKKKTNRDRILCVWLCIRGNCRDPFVTLEEKRNCKNLSIHTGRRFYGEPVLKRPCKY